LKNSPVIIDDKIDFLRLCVMITRKRGTRDIQANTDIPGNGKVSISSSADKRDKIIQENLWRKLFLSVNNESEVMEVEFIKRSQVAAT
jgi:hypothetical protein